MDDRKCNCNDAAQTLIFACSGGTDMGELADRVARRLDSEGKGKMFCLAGVGGRVPGIMRTTEAATKILALDGCALGCVRHCLVEAGFTDFEHLDLGSLGLIKGQCPSTEENIAMVAARAEELLVEDPD